MNIWLVDGVGMSSLNLEAYSGGPILEGVIDRFGKLCRRGDDGFFGRHCRGCQKTCACKIESFKVDKGVGMLSSFSIRIVPFV